MPEAIPKPRRAWPGWLAMLLLVVAGQWWASERQRARDARVMAQNAEITCLVWWAAVQCDNR